MEDITYTKEEISAFIDILKNKLNINFVFDDMPLEISDNNKQYIEGIRRITFITNTVTMSKINIFDELNNAKNMYLNMDGENIHTIEAIDEFLNILNS
jgi:hypothetical protein